MSITANIKKLLLICAGVLATSAMLVLLIAAINKKSKKNCTGVDVKMSEKVGARFLNQQEVMAMLPSELTGKPLASLDLKKMEGRLEESPWINKAELFVTNTGVLRVSITEREPVARVFTVNGNSFYVDSTGKRLPLNNRMKLKLPVFTGFPSDHDRLSGADSALMKQVTLMAVYLNGHPFWMSQIEQTDINASRKFDMTPLIGKHTIAFGEGTDCEEKFHKLMLFYQQVGVVAGLSKYEAINLAFKDQVVATKKSSMLKSDSIQAIKNIRNMIDASRQMINDSVSTMVDNNIATSDQP